MSNERPFGLPADVPVVSGFVIAHKSGPRVHRAGRREWVRGSSRVSCYASLLGEGARDNPLLSIVMPPPADKDHQGT
jgi:hypothetical protein